MDLVADGVGVSTLRIGMERNAKDTRPGDVLRRGTVDQHTKRQYREHESSN